MPSTHLTSQAERQQSLALGAPSLYRHLPSQSRNGSSELLFRPAADGSGMGAVTPRKAPVEAAASRGSLN